MIDIIFALGSEKYSKYQKAFGFGEKPGIDLPNESAGILHTEAELRQPMYLATNSIGQGFNVNAIQMASAFSAVVNGGRMFRPRVVKEIEDRSQVIAEYEPELTNKVISKETSYILRRALLKVVSEGTGRAARIEGVELGGKTGTAQQGDRNEENLIHSFIGYYLSPEKPDTPEILILVTINRPSVETENPSAAPYFKKIMTGILQYGDSP
jgi:stage V sporulation protein D (sporulation-specific penicillin-binding protein)